MTVLYCGNRNTQQNKVELYRSAKPINTTTCQCYDFYGEDCVAWCSAAHFRDVEIVNITSNQTFKATCTSGKQALGCYLSPLQGSAQEPIPAFYPTDGGSSCTCRHSFGAECLAMCASRITNYEINEVSGNGTVIVSCTKPGNTVLGCGSDGYEAVPNCLEDFPSTRVSSSSTCECFNRFHVKCYAICGLQSIPASTTAIPFSSTASAAASVVATVTRITSLVLTLIYFNS